MTSFLSMTNRGAGEAFRKAPRPAPGYTFPPPSSALQDSSRRAAAARITDYGLELEPAAPLPAPSSFSYTGSLEHG